MSFGHLLFLFPAAVLRLRGQEVAEKLCRNPPHLKGKAMLHLDAAG